MEKAETKTVGKVVDGKVKVTNTSGHTLFLESGPIAPKETGIATIAEAAYLVGEYVEEA